jgi:putative flavoprotein involved in K+ transport
MASARAYREARPIYIIGGGPAGLAVAAVLGKRGIPVTVLERTENIAASWRTYYDNLRLPTVPRLSGLPGMRIQATGGRWVSRDDMVRYLERYAAVHRIDIVTGVDVQRIDRGDDAGQAGDDAGQAGDDASQAGDATGNVARWLLRLRHGTIAADTVVVATGYSHTPHVPDWPGQASFPATIGHARNYRNSKPYANCEVLVVGGGNAGADIAVDLAHGGASSVRLAVAAPPHIIRRDMDGWAGVLMAMLTRRLPDRLFDYAARWISRLSLPDLSRYGLARPADDMRTRLARDRAVPVWDTGLVSAVRSGAIEVVPRVVGFDHGKVRLADGSMLSPDAVIAATGYRQGLETLTGHLGVLDEDGLPCVRGAAAAPGLYFAGYTLSLHGHLHEIAAEARRIARAIRAEHRRTHGGAERRWGAGELEGAGVPG